MDFLRRQRTCTTLSISDDLPMTGSRVPSEASSVRSRQKYSRAEVAFSASPGLLAPAALRASKSFSWLTPYCHRIAEAPLSILAIARRKCSVEMKSESSFEAWAFASASIALALLLQVREVLSILEPALR